MTEVRRSAVLAWTDSNILTAPEAPGVYILRPQDQTIGYVGSAGPKRLRARLQEHKALNDHPKTAFFDWYEHSDEVNARQTEQAWIQQHKPPWNG